MGGFEVRYLFALASSLRWVALADGATRLECIHDEDVENSDWVIYDSTAEHSDRDPPSELNG
jgi:hypothetical protein